MFHLHRLGLLLALKLDFGLAALGAFLGVFKQCSACVSVVWHLKNISHVLFIFSFNFT